jgi:hypothetical protein
MAETPGSDRNDTSNRGDATEQGGQQQGAHHGNSQQGEHSQDGYQTQQVQTVPSIGDIFSRQDTMAEIKRGAVLYGIIGVGILVAGALTALLVNYGQASGVITGSRPLQHCSRWNTSTDSMALRRISSTRHRRRQASSARSFSVSSPLSVASSRRRAAAGQ